MKGLFYLLDQLSNMHFTPRPPMNDTKI